MDYFLLLNIFAELLICSGYMVGYNKRAFRMVENAFKNIPKKEIVDKDVSMETMQARITAATWFIMISGIILTAGFITLFFIQYTSAHFPPYIETLISTGIHTPVLFLIIGLIIRNSYNVYAKKTNNTSLSTDEMKTIVTLMAVILDATLIVLDWGLCLFVAAIILGKYIWIDFIFDGKSFIDRMKTVIKTIKNKEDVSVEFLCFNYAIFFYPSFIIVSGAYQFLLSGISDASAKLQGMLSIYLALISLSVIALDSFDRVI